MLKRVVIDNFRCLKHVEVDVRPLTVLIGPNDSGKSAFLAALEWLIERRRGLERAADVWRFRADVPVAIIIKTEQGPYGFRGPSSRGWNVDGVLPKDVSPIAYFRLPSHGIAAVAPGYSDTGDPPQLGPHGGQIPSLIDYFLRRDRDRFFKFVKAAGELVPGLEDIHVATPSPEQRRLDLVIEGKLKMPVDQASAGVQLTLFFLALAYHPTPPRTILLEEPENGVHPRRLAQIMGLLRGLCQGRHGDHPSQVILTTHSPYLLDHVDLDHDQVLVFRRNDDGSCTAEPVDKERLKQFLGEFMLGEVWFNEEEGGLVKRKA